MGSCLIKTFFNLRNLLSCLLLISSFSLFAQRKEKVELVRAETLDGVVIEGVKAQKLIGNVVLKHQNTLMYCDTAFLYSKTNNIDAYGSIRINQGDTLNLYGDKLNYISKEGLAIVTGKEVKLIGKEFTLVTDRLYYNRIKNSAVYNTGGIIESNKDANLLSSRVGYFYMNRSLFTFKDSVKLSNPEFNMVSDTLEYSTNTKVVHFLGPTTIKGDNNLIYCENGFYNTKNDKSQYYSDAYIISDGRKIVGDTLFYDRAKGYGQADGHVEITDTAENVIITGEHCRIYEEKDSAIVTNKSMLTQVFDEDSLFIRADTFKFFGSADSERKLFAYYDVRIFKSDLQGRCDSISYLLSDSIVKLHNDPVLWSESNQLTADSISLQIANGKIQSIYLDKNAFIISQLDSIRFNQIKGKEMRGYFKDSKLSKVEVRGNGQTTYYGQDETNKFIGVNVAESSNIDIHLKDQAIDGITFLNRPKAVMYPMGTLDPVTELRYRGFSWRIKEKPLNKNELLK